MNTETELQTEAEVVNAESNTSEVEGTSTEAVPGETSAETPAAAAEPDATATPVAVQEVVNTESSAPAAETTSAETVASEASVETPAAVAPATPVAAAESSDDADGGNGRVVRTLAVGQEVLGTIKRTSEFGAFIDIGVGRDGLVHVSELSTRRVAKVTDVLKEGQQATFWIKELDRERNRISLTMIKPGTKTVRTMQKGDIITGVVTRIMAYGAFVDVGIGRDALLHVREMGERFVPKPEDVVTVGEEIEARIIEIERRRARVDLSVKGLRPEPEPEEPEAPTPAEAAAAAQAEAEAELVDKFADIPVMSAIEAAFKKAMGESASEKAEKARRASNASAKARALQEDVLSRTLKSSN